MECAKSRSSCDKVRFDLTNELQAGKIIFSECNCVVSLPEIDPEFLGRQW